MTELEKYIHTYFGVINDDLTKISSFFKPVTLKKGDYFLKTGRHSDRLVFVQTGMANINNWANWQTHINKPKLNGELKPETTFDWKTGGAKIHSTLHAVEPFKTL